jgi:tRNA(Arg) A34 adenosine deaminase TadA
MGCVIVRNETVLTNGWSHVPQSTKWRHYSLHAEMHALARGRYMRLKGSIAYIAAVSRKSGRYTTAKPCLDCAIALKSAGVDAVFYTTPDTSKFGFLRIEELESMLSELKVYGSPDGS